MKYTNWTLGKWCHCSASHAKSFFAILLFWVAGRKQVSNKQCLSPQTANLFKTRWWGKEGTRNNRFSVRPETSWCRLLLPLPSPSQGQKMRVEKLKVCCWKMSTEGNRADQRCDWNTLKCTRFSEKYCMQPPLCLKIKTHPISSPPSPSSTSPWRHFVTGPALSR